MFVLIVIVYCQFSFALRRYRRHEPVSGLFGRGHLVLERRDVHLDVVRVVRLPGLRRGRRRLATFQGLAHKVRQPLHHHYCREHASPRAAITRHALWTTDRHRD